MGFWADLTETPWNREIKLLKEKLAESEERNRKLKERSSRLTAELDKIKGDLRASEHSELTLRVLKLQLEAELDTKDPILPPVDRALARAETLASTGSKEVKKFDAELAGLFNQRAQSLGKKRSATGILAEPPSLRRQKNPRTN
ncbi:hypothetical protein GTA08_BOTSDO03017 [Botryosphaeria dothidea]|uniref:Uncharacterized protein n=1 Tax=Botryosphaeria dothidea TaxID=55169 RepID=A0A8H4NC93_9PEZI|nr:hypothetical protein GTA08_BOTSDO03017 [Botryosphaeria dothidea]